MCWIHKEPYGHLYQRDDKMVGGISIQRSTHGRRVWQRRGRWFQKISWDGKWVWAFGMMSAAATLRRENPLTPVWWWGKQISARTQKNREDSWIWDGERERQWVTVRLTKHGESTGHWAVEGRGGGLKILEWCQLYLLCCQRTMAARDCQGWKDRRHRIQNERRVYARQKQPSES